MSLADRTLALDSRFLGALPIVNHFLARMGLPELFQWRLPPPDPRCRVAADRVLMTLLRSLIVDRVPLYSVSGWATSMSRIPRLTLKPGRCCDKWSVVPTSCM